MAGREGHTRYEHAKNGLADGRGTGQMWGAGSTSMPGRSGIQPLCVCVKREEGHRFGGPLRLLTYAPTQKASEVVLGLCSGMLTKRACPLCA